jgi:hypothetical protein
MDERNEGLEVKEGNNCYEKDTHESHVCFRFGFRPIYLVEWQSVKRRKQVTQRIRILSLLTSNKPEQLIKILSYNLLWNHFY